MNHAAPHHLEDLLDREISAAQGLVQTLADERSALTGDSPQAVVDKAAEKVQLLENLDRLENERRALWGSAEAARFGAAVAERWRALMELMAACRAANEVNGHIIQIRQNQIRQLIDIARGGAPMTYGPSGKTFARALRALARA